MAQWHCTIGGRQYGPVEEDVLRQWVREGRVQPTDPVWTEGWAEWAPAGSVPGLSDGAPPPAPGLVPVVSSGGTGGHTPITQLMGQGWQSLKGNWGIAVALCLLLALIGFIGEAIGAAVKQVSGPAATGVKALDFIATILLTGPFTVGLCVFMLTLVRRGKPRIGMILDGFTRFGTALAAYVLVLLLTAAAVLCPLIVGGILGAVVGAAGGSVVLGIVLAVIIGYIPGLIAAIVVSLMFAQTFYVLADNTAIGPWEAMLASKRMMAGRKLKLFGMNLLLVLIALAVVAPLAGIAAAMIYGSPESSKAMVLVLLVVILVTGVVALILWPWFMATQARFYDDLAPRPQAVQPAAGLPATPVAPAPQPAPSPGPAPGLAKEQ